MKVSLSILCALLRTTEQQTFRKQINDPPSNTNFRTTDCRNIFSESKSTEVESKIFVGQRDLEEKSEVREDHQFGAETVFLVFD